MTAHHNDWDTSAQWSESSSSITSSFDTEIVALKAKMAEINKNLMRVLQIPQPQVVTTNEFTNFMKANDAILKNMQTNMTSLTKLDLELKNMFGQSMKMNTASSSGSRTLPGNTITNPKEDLKGITSRRGTAYPGPTIPTTSSSLVVEHETEVTKDTVHPTNNGSTEDVQPPVVPTESPILTSDPVNSPFIEPVASPVTQWSESSSSITSSFDTEIVALKAKMAEINKNLMRVLQVNQQVKAVTPNYETYGGPHSFSNCLATVGNTQNVYAAGAYQDLELKNMFGQSMKMNTASSSGSRTLPGNTITNPKEDLKGITSRRGTAYPGPTIPTTSSSLVVEHETEVTKDTVHPTNNGSTEDVQPPVVPTESPILTSDPVNSPFIEPVASPVSALMHYFYTTVLD
nr:hypothetical protein [Tanacetum cinerariifolium]